MTSANRISMGATREGWSPAQSAFVMAVLRAMVGMLVLVVLLGALIVRAWLPGLLSGALLAVALYLVAVHAGRILYASQSYARTMLWLMATQAMIWTSMAILLAWVKVHPIGFVCGATILPGAIVITLAWNAITRNRISL